MGWGGVYIEAMHVVYILQFYVRKEKRLYK